MHYQPVPDYHMHTPRCHHAKGDVREYAEAAIAAGLTEIGMSDHSPMPKGFGDDWRMDMQELTDYQREVESVRDDVSGTLIVRVGLEADFRRGSEIDVAAMIDAYDWDYVIGSVHYIEGWDFDNPDKISHWDGCNIENAWCSYFDLVAQSAATGMFDIIGHPDLIKKFGHRPPEGNKHVTSAMESMLQAVKKADCALEISSAGLRKPVKEIYPHLRIIQRAAEFGIPFAFGSDAHSPASVGHAMDHCLALLESCGIHKVCAFEQRNRRMLQIQKIS
ncbi:MAG: histidinol-phosphatase HisJ [Mariprofundaceae bacterium]|nr:histidinol-phosphatase HisJ [Mariprofundaceae bacterium]